ncbi:MAG: hypothetical protein K2I36_02445, partial [Ureaplasma sp.]|nr:hypothetical protein [Ureaplasma sp.]
SMCQSLLDLFVSIYEKIKLFDKGLFYFQTQIITFLNKTLEQKLNVSDSTIKSNKLFNEIKQDLINNSEPRSCFTTRVVMEHEPENKINVSKIIEEKQFLFNQIATNTSSKNKDKFVKIFNSLKLSPQEEYNPLLLAEKVVTSSNNGILLLFQFSSDLIKFDEWYWNEKIMNKICDLFDQKVIILGGTKQDIQLWKNKIDIDKKYLDVDIDKYFPDIALSEEEKIKKILEINNSKE